MDFMCGSIMLCRKRMEQIVCFIFITHLMLGVALATNSVDKHTTPTSRTKAPSFLHRQRREQPTTSGSVDSLLTPPLYDYSYDNFNNGFNAGFYDMFRIDSPSCHQATSCSYPASFPDRNCHCDSRCPIMRDCCKDYTGSTSSTITEDQFKCVQLTEIVKTPGHGVHMVTKCSSSWTHDETKRLCEEEASGDDLFLRVPVSDQGDDKFMYKNTYCAQCNYIFNFLFWNVEIKCRNETGVHSLPDADYCSKFFIPPKQEYGRRTCLLEPTINTCIDDFYADNCTNGQFYLVYDSNGRLYRNQYCAYCNGINEGLTCMSPEQPVTSSTIGPGERAVYPLSFLVNLNQGTVKKNGTEIPTVKCDNDTEILDAWSNKCRKLYCPPNFVLTNKSCVFKSHLVQAGSQEQERTLNCTLVKLSDKEYDLINSSSLLIISQNKIYTDDEFFIQNGSDVFMCSDKFSQCEEGNCDSNSYVKFDFNAVESYMSLVGMVISIIALTITLAVYVAFPQLMNIPGKILVCLIISLALAQLFFIIAPSIESSQIACSIIAKVVHYLFLCAFCWMNVIAIDLCMTFSNKFVTPGTGSRSKRFMFYSLYAWCIPLLIVVAAIVIDYVKNYSGFEDIKPNYGKGVCWISSKYGLIIFFLIPLGIFKVIDLVSFIFTSIYIARARKEGAMASQKRNTCSLLINIKLSLVMGLTWLFAFIANATKHDVIWYMFIIFNALQGLFIALSFLCTKKVIRLLHAKYEKMSSNLTSGTQLTSES